MHRRKFSFFLFEFFNYKFTRERKEAISRITLLELIINHSVKLLDSVQVVANKSSKK